MVVFYPFAEQRLKKSPYLNRKAHAYKLKLDAIKHQGVSRQVVGKLESADIVGLDNDETAIRKPRPRPAVTVIVEHEFIGDKTLAEAFIPVIVEDLRRKAEQPRTFDNKRGSA